MKARRVRRGARRGGARRAQGVLMVHRDRGQGDVALGGRARAPQVSRSRFRMVTSIHNDARYSSLSCLAYFGSTPKVTSLPLVYYDMHKHPSAASHIRTRVRALARRHETQAT